MAETYPNRFYHARGADRPVAQQRRPSSRRCRRSGTGSPPRASPAATTTPTCRSSRSGAAKYLPIAHPFPTSSPTARAATLPEVSFVDPALHRRRLGHRRATTTRTPTSASARRSSTRSTRRSRRSPAWENTVFVINYDEWGGFFDHVPPPMAPRRTTRRARCAASECRALVDLAVRAAAPRRAPPLRPHVDPQDDRVALGLAPLTLRDAHAHNIAEVLDFTAPDLHAPSWDGATRGRRAVPRRPILGFVEDFTTDSAISRASGRLRRCS